MKEDEDEIGMEREPALLEEEQLLVGPVAGHRGVHDLHVRKERLEPALEGLLALDAESEAEGVAEDEDPLRAGGRPRRAFDVAETLRADLDARRPVGERESARPALAERPPEARIRTEERDPVSRRRLPRRTEDARRRFADEEGEERGREREEAALERGPYRPATPSQPREK